MAGELELYQIQTGLETTWGTNVAPTARLIGIESIEVNPGVEQKALTDMRGSYAPSHVSQITRIMPTGTYEGWASYEDIHYWLEGMVGEVTPSGAMAPYTRTGAAPGIAPILGRAQTLVYGGREGVYALNGALPTTFTFSVNSNEEARFSGDIMAKDRVIDVLGVLADRVVTPIMGDHVKIYIDPIGGTIGATEIAALAFSVELELNANRTGKPHLASLTADTLRGPKWSGSLTAVLEFDATVVNTLMDEFFTPEATITEFAKQVRIAALVGTGTSVKSLTLDFAGFQETAPVAFTDTDGIASIEFNLTGSYNSNLGNWFEYSGQNGVATLP